MIFWSITISNLIWILYSVTEGVRESFFTHYKNQSKRCDEYKFSAIFYLQRFLVLLTTSLILIHALGLWSIPFIIGQILMFHFFHKISFSQICKKIGNEEKSEQNKASILEKLNKSFVFIGIALQIFVYIFLL